MCFIKMMLADDPRQQCGTVFFPLGLEEKSDG